METQTLKDIIMDRYDAADRWLTEKREKWDDYEQLFHNQLADAISGATKSQVFDPILATLTLDRSARVMAQVPSGKVKPISKNDMGAGKLMNLTLDKYIVPNANAQFDFLTKGRMVDLYSNIYGNFFVMVDWDVRENGYMGPDMWLIPIRDVFPQVGAVSIEDSDYIIIRTWRPLSFFEGLKDTEGVKNIPEIIDKLKQKSGDKQGRDSNHTSQREQNQYASGAEPAKQAGYFEVLSMYERDRWVDYCVAAELEFRDGPNPHEDGELPVICKYSIPLLDDFMGMGDFERGKSMQMTANSLWNLYLDGVKVSIFPPVLFDKGAIAEKSSIKWSAAAKWMMKGNPANAAQVLQLTPQGQATFNNSMTAVKTSLLNMFGTTDTTVTQQVDPGFGKTPEALKQQAARENARDNVDRFYMEQFLTKVNKKFVNLMSKHSSKVQIRMFEEEIDEIAKQHPEIKEMYDSKTGKLTIDKSKTGSILYDYEIVSGSTYATDQQAQKEFLLGMFKAFTEGIQFNQQTGKYESPLMSALESDGTTLSLKEMLTRIMANSGLQDWDKILIDKNSDPDKMLQDNEAKFMQILQSLGAPGVDSVPAQPGAMPEQQMPPMQPMPGGPPMMGGANGQGSAEALGA